MCTKARPRPAVPVALPNSLLPPISVAAGQPNPAKTVPVLPVLSRNDEPRVYWGDLGTVLFWSGCFALLAGMILLKMVPAFFNLFR